MIRLLGLAVLCGLLGCGGSGNTGEDRSDWPTVTGTVTLDGKPLETGTIAFVRSDDAAQGRAPASTKIQGGNYSLPVSPGDKQVKITATEEYGEPDVTGVKQTRQLIPARYNEQTELKTTIPEDGGELTSFALQTK